MPKLNNSSPVTKATFKLNIAKNKVLRLQDQLREAETEYLEAKSAVAVAKAEETSSDELELLMADAGDR